MLLNGQRLFSFVAFFATLLLIGCVDIPSDGPTPPNYRSSIKFFNAGSGRDTIAFPISKITYTRKDSTTSTVNTSGTDSVRTKIVYTQSVSVNRYRRYDVNFAQSFEVFIDGASKGTIAHRAASTGYFDVASGNRLFTLKGSATNLDSIRIVKIDTVVTTTRDTIKAGTVTSRIIFDTTRSGTSVFTIPLTGTSTITLDSTTTTLATETQYSMYLAGRTAALEQNEGGLARYGRINFLNTVDRLLFQPAGKPDTAIVKFVHAFPDTGSYAITTTKAGGTDFISALAFGTATGKLIKAKNDTTYLFYVRRGTVYVDSVSVAVSNSKRYSVVIQSNSGVRATQAYTH